MRKPYPYESYLLFQPLEYNERGYCVPMWLANEIRAYQWMLDLWRATDSNCNGYTISRALIFRIGHAPESHCMSFQELSPQMRRMTDDFINLLNKMNREVLSHYDSNKTVQLPGGRDRLLWDEIWYGLDRIIQEKPDREWRKEHEAVSPSPYVTMKELWR